MHVPAEIRWIFVLFIKVLAGIRWMFVLFNLCYQGSSWDQVNVCIVYPGSSWNQVLGDTLCIAGAIMYGISNIFQEYIVCRHGCVEYLAMLGIFASVINGVQLYVLLLYFYWLSLLRWYAQCDYMSIYMFYPPSATACIIMHESCNN